MLKKYEITCANEFYFMVLSVVANSYTEAKNLIEFYLENDKGHLDAVKYEIIESFKISGSTDEQELLSASDFTYRICSKGERKEELEKYIDCIILEEKGSIFGEIKMIESGGNG